MPWLLLAGLWLSYVAFGVVVASLAPLVPLITRDLGLGYTAIGGIMGAWQLAYIAAAIPAGIVLDRLGGRVGLAIGVGLIGLSAIGRAFAQDHLSLMLAVMLAGIGGPVVSSGAPKIVAGLFEGSRRGFAMGLYITGASVGVILPLTLTHPVLLPAFGGSWRGVMLFWGAFGCGGALLWYLVAGIAGRGIASIQPAPPVAGAPGPSPLATVRELVRLPALRLLLLLGIGAFLNNHALNNWLPELLRNRGMSAEAAGFWAAFPLFVGLFAAPLIPRLATRERRNRIILALCVAAVVVSLMLCASALPLLATSLFLQGLVRSCMLTVLMLALVELPGIDARRLGIATGLFFSVAEVGGVLGPLCFGIVHDVSGGFDAGLYLLAAIAVAMAMGALRLARIQSLSP